MNEKLKDKLVPCPVTLKESQDFIARLHRHHPRHIKWKLGVGLKLNDKVVGVVVLSRPIARGWDDKKVIEVIRLCTDGTPHACSKLYGIARRISFEMGFEKIITYILETEDGTSLKAAGWTKVRKTKGGSWSCKSRPRKDKAPTCPKILYESNNNLFA